MKQILLNTDSSNTSALIQRVILGAIIFPHGAQKLLGWFGGYGFTGSMGFLTESMGLPWIIGFLVILFESVGALLLIAGLGTRVFAGGIVAVMIGAMLTLHLEHGFFMNWYGSQAGEGFEYHLLAVGLGVSLIVSGGGLWSVDSLFTQAKKQKVYAVSI